MITDAAWNADTANPPLGEYLKRFALYLGLRMVQTGLIDVFRYDRFGSGECVSTSDDPSKAQKKMYFFCTIDHFLVPKHPEYRRRLQMAPGIARAATI